MVDVVNHPYRRLHAVGIGVSRYADAQYDLDYARSDAQFFVDVLGDEFGFESAITLLDANATRANILGVFENELQAADDDDGVVVFFAGHGITVRDALGVDRGFLIPHDGVPTQPLRNLSVTYLRDELLPMIPAKHVFLIIDACYGGLALRDVVATPRPSIPDASLIAELTRSDRKVRQVLSAGGRGQRVLDGGLYGRSVFTGHLVRALRDAQPYVFADQLGAVVRERVARESADRGHPQTPGFGYLAGSEGTFVFTRQPKAEADAETGPPRQSDQLHPHVSDSNAGAPPPLPVAPKPVAPTVTKPRRKPANTQARRPQDPDAERLDGGYAGAVAFSPDGRFLAIGLTSGSVRVWDVSRRQLQDEYEQSGQVTAVAVSARGRTIAVGSLDGTLRLWDTRIGQPASTLAHTGGVYSLAFSPDGRQLVSGTSHAATLWDARSGHLLHRLRGLSLRSCVAFAPQGALLAALGSETVEIFDARMGRSLRSLEGHTSWPTSVAFAPRGSLLASGSHDQTVRLWDPKSGRTIGILRGHTDEVRSVAFSGTGQLLASGSADHTVRVWDVRSGTSVRVHDLHEDVTAVACSPDGKLIAALTRTRSLFLISSDAHR